MTTPDDVTVTDPITGLAAKVGQAPGDQEQATAIRAALKAQRATEQAIPPEPADQALTELVEPEPEAPVLPKVGDPVTLQNFTAEVIAVYPADELRPFAQVQLRYLATGNRETVAADAVRPAPKVDEWARIQRLAAVKDERGLTPEEETEHYRLLGGRYDRDGSHNLRETKPRPGADPTAEPEHELYAEMEAAYDNAEGLEHIPAAALKPGILAMYGGTAEDPGVWDLMIVHFPSVRQAAMWVDESGLDARTVQFREMDGWGPCTVQVTGFQPKRYGAGKGFTMELLHRALQQVGDELQADADQGALDFLIEDQAESQAEREHGHGSDKRGADVMVTTSTTPAWARSQAAAQPAHEHPDGAGQAAGPPRKSVTPPAGQANWLPAYEPWRHGGWYVTNIRYPSGAVGCVSRNYPDSKWRIVCDDRPDAYDLNTYPTRDAAARAERELATAMWERVAELAARLAPVAGTGTGPNDRESPCAACGTVVLAGKGRQVHEASGPGTVVLDGSCAKAVGREQDDPGGVRTAPADYARHVSQARQQAPNALAAESLPHGPGAGPRPDNRVAASSGQSAHSAARRQLDQSPRAARGRGRR